METPDTILEHYQAKARPLPTTPVTFSALLRRLDEACLLYTSPSPRDRTRSRMPSSA